ncbi:hypothetical protein MHYP_G00206140 [Metynnis hypsauchen]
MKILPMLHQSMHCSQNSANQLPNGHHAALTGHFIRSTQAGRVGKAPILKSRPLFLQENPHVFLRSVPEPTLSVHSYKKIVFQGFFVKDNGSV